MTATGTRPLLLHNERLASPLNGYAKRLKELNSKPSKLKTDEDRLEIARVEWEGSMYWQEELGPYLPGPNLFASLVSGAKLSRDGKKIERGVSVVDLYLPLLYRGPRDLDGLWGGGESEFIDVRTVRVQRAKVDRCRPMFRDWQFEAEVLLDPAVIGLEEFKTVCRNAGQFEGVGDYRRMYGRYEAKIQQL